MLAHQRLRSLIVEALSTAPAVCSHVKRGATRPLPEGIGQGVFVRVLGGPGEALVMGGEAPIDWHATVAIDCVARAAAGQAGDEAVGPLLVAVHRRLMVDTTLGAAGFSLLPQFEIRFDGDDLDDRIGGAQINFRVRWCGPFDHMEA